MKILWLVNIIMPELAEHLGQKPTVFGGWLTGAMNAVRDHQLELVVVTNDNSHTAQTRKYVVRGVTYYITCAKNEDEMRLAFRQILSDEAPDVVHLYGTEFEQSWAMAQEADPNRLLISVQGLVTYCLFHVYGGVPPHFWHTTWMHRLLRLLHGEADSMNQQRLRFEARSVTEKKTIQRARFINGGTAWGTACTAMINPQAVQLPCELILRDCFYEADRWDYDACEKHSILVLYGAPLKGFDMLLRALPTVLERFPDTKVYVMGMRCRYRKLRGIRRWIMNQAPDYDWYVQSLIEQYHLKDHLVFCGYLSAEQVKSRLLKTNVFVSPSSIENHSTALGEAMITGVPSISSCVGGLQEMIQHGEDGFLYPFDEPYILAYDICRLFEDRNLAEKFSEKGQIHASRTFHRDNNLRDLLRMYEIITNNLKQEGQQ